jgi:hypothetical protein
MTSLCAVRTLAILLAVVSALSPAFAGKAIEARESPISRNQILDPTQLQRHSNREVEVIIVQQVRGSGLLSFYLDGRPVAKLDYADWVRLYLEPRRYRFGVAPSPNFGRAVFWQMTAEISPKRPRFYKIFQSAGFTSSGGNAVYEISQVDFPLK